MTTTAQNSRGENVDEIQSLSAQIDLLSRKVDWWNTAIVVMVAVAALAATGLLITQFIAFKRAGQLAAAQAGLSKAKEGKLSGELKEKDRQIAALDVKANEAGIGIATAQTDASNAAKKAADAITAQQNVEIDLAKQKERTALAERDLITLQEKVKPRHLSDAQKTILSDKLRGVTPVAITISWSMSSEDGAGYGKDFADVFRGLGWNITPADMMSAVYSGPFVGVMVSIKSPPGPSQAGAIQSAIGSTGISAPGNIDPSVRDGSVAIKIGNKQ
jgi:hypothetical protein